MLRGGAELHGAEMSDGVLQTGNVTPGHLASWATDGVVQDAGITFSTSYGMFVATLLGVNFNVTGDTPANILLPLGYTRYRMALILLAGATGVLTTATCGVFTAPGAGGTAVVTSGTAITITQTLPDTVNNMQALSINNQNTMALSDSQLFFRVQNPQGLGVFANVSMFYVPLP
jgi:hypothetical protein